MTPLDADKQWCADFLQGYHLSGAFRRFRATSKAQRFTFAVYFAAEMLTSRGIRKP